jgi:nitrogen fixation NifU-like protein
MTAHTSDDKRIELLRAMGYSKKGIDFIIHKTNVGELENPTVSAKHQGTCGDIMILHLYIHHDKITQAKYEYLGCAGLQAAGSALTELIIGKKITSAERLDAQKILDYLGGLPVQKHECASLASQTLKKALEKYHSGQAA